MAFANGQTIELSGTDDAPGIAHEKRLWREYSLAMIFPSRVPEYIPDAVIGEKLRMLEREREPFPWTIDYPLFWSESHGRPSIV